MSQNNNWIQIAKDIGFNNKNIYDLHQIPINREKKNEPKTPIQKINTTQQCDILYLPDDNGYKFLFVLIDYNRFVAVRPLKTITAKDIIRCFKYIYRNTVLNYPFIIQMDNGKEFNNKFIKAYFKNKSNIKYIKPYRSRQNGLVEHINFLIGKVIGIHQSSIELKTNKESNKWRSIVKYFVKSYNKLNKNKGLTIKNKKYPPFKKGKSQYLLKLGNIVKIPLEIPIHVDTNKKYKSKKFRSNDIRYNPKNYKITNVILKPSQVPLYMVNQKNRVAYTKQQLIFIREK